MKPAKKRVRKPKGPPTPVRTRWEKSADRENERRWNKSPLFVHAGLIPLATPEERQRQIEGGRQAQDVRDEERRIEHERREGEAREQVRSRVSPEDFAALDASSKRHGEFFWTVTLRELDRAGEPAPPPPPKPVRERRVQFPIFAEVGGAEVLLVRDGKTLPEEELRALAAPDLVKAEAAVSGPCPGCGWQRQTDGLSLLRRAHPNDCLVFTAFLLGMRRRCETACKKGIHHVCDEHLAAVTACRRDGHPDAVLHESTGSFVCPRCAAGLSVDAAIAVRLAAGAPGDVGEATQAEQDAWRARTFKRAG